MPKREDFIAQYVHYAINWIPSWLILAYSDWFMKVQMVLKITQDNIKYLYMY